MTTQNLAFTDKDTDDIPGEPLPYPNLKPGTYKVTFVSLKWTNGTKSVYEVYRAKLHVLKVKSMSYIDMKRAEVVAAYSLDGEKTWKPKYLTWALEHATPEYPAFNWGHDDSWGQL